VSDKSGKTSPLECIFHFFVSSSGRVCVHRLSTRCWTRVWNPYGHDGPIDSDSRPKQGASESSMGCIDLAPAQNEACSKPRAAAARPLLLLLLLRTARTPRRPPAKKQLEADR
jgi:hypothetical protein